MSNEFVKDPSARLDYRIDWAEWLGDDTITTSAWELPDGITQYATSNTDTSATIWLVGGAAQKDYTVTNQILTAGGRINQQSLKILVRQR